MFLIKKIRSIDYETENKIAIIYSGNLDVTFYKDCGIYNVYLFVQEVALVSYRVYDVCKFCQNGQDSVNWINTWSFTKGFREPPKFLPSFRGNYHQTNLTIGAFFIYPNIYAVGKNEDGSDILDGYHYRAYKFITDSLNAKLQFVTHKGRINFWNYYYDLVVYKKTDVTGGGWATGHFGYDWFGDISTGITYSDGYKIISIEPLKGIDPMKAFITPFDKYRWMLFFATIPLYA